MSIHQIDPLCDPRWRRLVVVHRSASIFHTPEWLKALAKTYGYKPLVFTSSPPGTALTNGMVFCQVDSWLTGRRLVSLPFSDHCEPLVESGEELAALLAALKREQQGRNWKYIEIRPRNALRISPSGFEQQQSYCFHSLDLRPSGEELFRNFQKSGVQRKIQRARREGLTLEEGRSEKLLQSFYRLLLLTRRRQQLPPQPDDWFRNLLDCLGPYVTIRVASKGSEPIASILTLRYRNTLVYKYGCSDSRFHHLGGMALLFWTAIETAKRQGLEEFDLGRSDYSNPGLIAFKDHWGGRQSELAYLRYPGPVVPSVAAGYGMRMAKRVCLHAPDPVLTLAGKLLYKHIG